MKVTDLFEAPSMFDVELAPGVSVALATGYKGPKITPELARILDDKANGADDVVYQGKTYVRTGPKNPASKPGPWRLQEAVEQLTDADKAAILADFKQWSGGFTPDEVPVRPDASDAEDEPTHQSYVENGMDSKFAGKEAAVLAFLASC